MADSVKVIVKDNQEQVSLFIGQNTGQWVDTADGIEYVGDAYIDGYLEVDGNLYVKDEMQVDGGVNSTRFVKLGGLPTEFLMADGGTTKFDGTPTEFLMADGSTQSFVANGEYTDNADALAGGLSIGDVYRTGDLMKIVH